MRKQNFVLVHGAWHGGWCWSRTVDCLNPYNEFAVFAPTLTGLGERGHLTSPIPTLDTHIEDIVRVITYNDLHDVVLVGHSYAGMVVTGVADFLGPRLKHIVYLDAAVPEEGDDFASRCDVVATGTAAERRGRRDSENLYPGDEPGRRDHGLSETGRTRKARRRLAVPIH